MDDSPREGCVVTGCAPVLACLLLFWAVVLVVLR